MSRREILRIESQRRAEQEEDEYEGHTGIDREAENTGEEEIAER